LINTVVPKAVIMVRTLAGTAFLLLFFVLPFTAMAILPVAIEQRFALLSGAIIMPIADEYLIDLDASANLQIGDILTLVTPGEKVLHPITKELLGTIDSPVGFLRVTRIESGYCYARLLYSSSAPQKGSLLRRFDHAPSRFTDKQGSRVDFYQELKSSLPHLDWLLPDSNEKALLQFTLDGSLLSVTSPPDSLLFSGSIADDVPDNAD
jgi:hypothetical protein